MSAVPANVAPYVEVLGTDGAMEFFLTFGGAPVYLAAQPQSRSQVVALIGMAKAKALAKAFGAGHVRVPTAKPWIAQQLSARGMALNAIARKLHVNDFTVRNYLRKAEPEQLSLFD